MKNSFAVSNLMNGYGVSEGDMQHIIRNLINEVSQLRYELRQVKSELEEIKEEKRIYDESPDTLHVDGIFPSAS